MTYRLLNYLLAFVAGLNVGFQMAWGASALGPFGLLALLAAVLMNEAAMEKAR